MQISKKMLLGLVLGAAVAGSMGSVAAQSGDDPTPNPPGEVEKEAGDRFIGGPGPHGRHGKAIRSISVIAPEEEGGEFRTVRTDAGTIESIDGNTLTIAEEDGEKVEVAITDDTDVRRDGEEAEVGDLEVGDHVRTHREKEGDGEYVTNHVGALSAERYAEMQARRQVCEDDPSAENCGRRFHGPGRFRPGMRAPADEPATEESSADAA